MISIPTLDHSRPGQLKINGRRYRGHLYRTPHGEVELYRISTLSSALGKGPQSIQNWELRGWFPKPLYTIVKAGSVTRRWYSREQIINMHNLLRVIPYGRGVGRRHLRLQFFKAVKSVFDKRTIVNLKKKESADGGKEATGDGRPTGVDTTRIAQPHQSNGAGEANRRGTEHHSPNRTTGKLLARRHDRKPEPDAGRHGETPAGRSRNFGDGIIEQ